MIKKILLPFIFLGTFIKIHAQAPSYQWVTVMGGTDYDYTGDIINDHDGNTYIAGWFNDTTVIGNSTFINPAYKSGGILVKLNPSGNITWVKRIGNPGFAQIEDLAFDNAGNLLMTGSFSDTLLMGNTTFNFGRAPGFAGCKFRYFWKYDMGCISRQCRN